MKLKIKKSQLWIVGAGVALAFGFFNNCLLTPLAKGQYETEWINWLFHLFKNGEEIEWRNLIEALFIMLGINGGKDVILRPYLNDTALQEQLKKTQSKGFWTNKIWIPAIGWCIAGGLANNCCFHPYFGTGEVEWTGLLLALFILLTVSGAREYGLNIQEKKILNSSSN